MAMSKFTTVVLDKINVLMITLITLSISLGVYILATDEHIYDHAISHAYGLMVFVGAYAILLGLLKFHPNIAKAGILIMASVQFVAMSLDILTTENIPIFQVQGLAFNELLEHLYGSWYFDVLLAVQAILITLSIVSRRCYAKALIGDSEHAGSMTER